MSVRPVIVLLLTFVVNVLANVWDGGGIAVHVDPKAHFEFVFLFLLPFITYLVGLYLTAALVEWHRFVRALALCGVSVAATFIAVPVALVFGIVVDVQHRKGPDAKPNHAIHADSSHILGFHIEDHWRGAGGSEPSAL